MFLLQIISDIIMTYSTVLIINGFGVSDILSKKRKLLSFISISISSVIVETLYLHNYNEISTAIYILMFILAYKLAFGKLKMSHFYIMIVSELSISLISSFITLPLTQLISFRYVKIDIIMTSVLRIVFMVAACFVNKKLKYKNVHLIVRNMPKHINVLILAALVSTSFLLACNNLPVDNATKQQTVAMLMGLSSIFVIIIIFSLIINVTSKNYYTALNTLLEKQVSAQIAHYEKLEKLSSDMRTFRHDYINHLTSISALITEGFYDDAQGYIDRLTESTHRNETIFRTGNRLADAILTDKSENCKAFADIVFDGCITDKIGNSDICIILANALDNAAEACKSCPERGRISIESQVRQGYWKMVVRNPTVGADSEGIMKTSKKDERNHGFGLLSIEQAVKRYDGTMSVSIKNGVFELAVVLKLPMEKPQ